MADCHWVWVLLTTELTPCPSARWQQEERWLQLWTLSAMGLETAFAS